MAAMIIRKETGVAMPRYEALGRTASHQPDNAAATMTSIHKTKTCAPTALSGYEVTKAPGY